jgi:hypothetical protein
MHPSKEEIIMWAEAKQNNYSCSQIPAKYRFAENHFNELKKEYCKSKKFIIRF